MTTKEVKQWLWRARGIDREIESLKKTVGNEYDRITSITAKLSGISVSGTKDPHKFDSLVELEDTINRRIRELEAVKVEILNKINTLDDGRYRQVLKLYYVDCMTLEQIAVEMHYSFPHIKRLRFEAMNAIKMILE